MKTRIFSTLFALGSLLLAGCTSTADGAGAGNTSDSPPTSASPSPTVSTSSSLTITSVDAPATQPLEDSAGFIGIRRLTDAYAAPLTLAGVRAPDVLTTPVSDWVDAQAQAFTIDISQLPDPSVASLTMTPSQCGAAGSVLCYTIVSEANFPSPGSDAGTEDAAGVSATPTEESEAGASGEASASPSARTTTKDTDAPVISLDTRTTVKAWISDFTQGTVVDTVDLLSPAGKKELYTALAAFLGTDIPAESTAAPAPATPTAAAPDFLDAVFLNADGSLTLSVTRGALAEPEADALTVEIRENAAGTINSYLTPEGVTLRDTIVSQEAPLAIPETPVDCNKLSCVALTFDDGPGEYTAQLLDTLAEKHVKATFFVVGRSAATYPDLIAREVNEGHVVGNHTWSHPNLPTLSGSAMVAELDQTDQAVMAAGAPAPLLVRPPYGATNSSVRQMLAGRGEIAVLWSIDTLDWKNRNVAIDVHQAVDRTQPGSIVLMHDIHPETVQAVPEIIDELEDEGFVLVTVPELLGEGYEQYAGMTVYSQQRIF